MSIWIGVSIEVPHDIYDFISDVDNETFEHIGSPELYSFDDEYFFDYTLAQEDKLPVELEFSEIHDNYEDIVNSIENLRDVVIDHGFSNISEDIFVTIR